MEKAINNKAVQAVYFRDYPDHDCIWACIRGSDGRFYFSLCSEGKAALAHLMSYDCRTGKVEDLVDIGDLSGERLREGKLPQSKIHLALCESSDKKIYGATHVTAPPPNEDIMEVFGTYGHPDRGYSGSYLFSYDIVSKKPEFMGLAIPFEGVRRMVLDDKRKRAYLISYPKHCLYVYDLVKRKSRNLGRIGMLGAFDLFIDNLGRIFGTNDAGYFYRYDPESDKIQNLSIKLPGHPWRNSPYNFLWYPVRGKGDWIYGTTYYDGHLFQYNPYEGSEGIIEDLGPGCGKEIDDNHWAAAYIQSPVFDKDWNLYYGYAPIWEPVHLVKFDTKRNEKVDLGAVNIDGYNAAFFADSAAIPEENIICFADITMNGIPRLLLIDLKKIQESLHAGK